MKSRFITLAVLVIFACNLYSQSAIEEEGWHFGFRGGVGMSWMTGLNKAKSEGLPNVDYYISSDFKAKPKFLWEIGFSFQYIKPKEYFIQIDYLAYTEGGAKLNGVGRKSNDDITALNMPSMQLKSYFGKKVALNSSGSTRFVVGGDPYLAYLFPGYGGSSDTHYYEVYDPDYDYWYEESYSVGGDKPDVNNIEIGANILAGIECKDTQFALTFDYGITKPFKNSRLNSRNMSVRFIITTYIF
ncbi:hypothetical protein [Dysgonomonas sp. 25]|uniref:hypothetical protein n=1 Tax=Dysgonomonas sp. 25 TaxID=2302933 RepID=UPI0013D2F74B|nr:hypothetical protein [Dysgonomonas sp. 25]NDV69606.1 hypothetical protein [Dysgonomonas sp. 25]